MKVANRTAKRWLLAGAVFAGALNTAVVQAAVTTIEGAAGGGIVPWALIHPEGPLVSYTNVKTNDFTVQSLALGGTVAGRFELSVAHQMLNAPTVGGALGLDNRINQDVFGAKVKLVDMGKDSAMPQIAVGFQAKRASGAILDALKKAGAISDTSGIDWYGAATKVVSVGGKSVLLNGTLRATKANQFGLLGFGGGTLKDSNQYKIKPEVSAGVFLADNIVLGGEYRTKPNNISSAAFGIKEEGAWDIFMAYFVNKNMAITAAYANLGQVGPSRTAVSTMSAKQDGSYLQLQVNF